MPAPKGLRDYIFNYKTKNNKGFTKGEISDVLRKYGIQQYDFSEKLGVVTCLMVEGSLFFIIQTFTQQSVAVLKIGIRHFTKSTKKHLCNQKQI